MSIPTLEVIRRYRTASEITILARTAVADLLSGQPFADRILEYDYRGRHRGWLGRETLIRELRDERFDVAILLQNAFEAAWLAWRAGIPERIGYARDGRRLLLTKAIPLPTAGPRGREFPRHESHYYFELLRRAGWVDADDEIYPDYGIRLTLLEKERRAAEVTLRESGARVGSVRCAIAPGASYGAAKCWPPQRFALLADRLISECGADVIFFGTDGEREITARILSEMKSRAISLVGKTSMRDLATLFSECSIFVGNDSGAMHVAAAAGIPVIGIFGSTDPEGTAPVTRQFTLVQGKASCSPCFLRQCPVDHRCMTRISVDSVFSAMLRTGHLRIDSRLRSAENA
jgi:heptosyltransferase-2